MIPNCEECKVELEAIEEYSKENLYFAGSGLFESGHLSMIMINYNGEIIVE